MDKIEDTKGKKRRVLSEERLSDKKTNNSQKNAKKRTVRAAESAVYNAPRRAMIVL